MSRDNEVQQFLVQNPATSTAGTVTTYFGTGTRPIMVKRSYMMGVNPSDTDGDTITSKWEYSTDGGANFTTIHDEAAFEYNDTTDTNALGDLGDSTAAVVDVSGVLDVRVPANAFIRHTEITAGTVTGTQVVSWLEYITL